MFTKNQIDNWIKLFDLSDNHEDFDQEPFNGRPFLKRDLVEAKVMIDRWNAITSDWIFHSSHKQMIMSLFENEKENTSLTALKDALKVLIKYSSILELSKPVDNLTEEEIKGLFKNHDFGFTFRIWGANVHFTDDIDPNIGLGLFLNPKDATLASSDSENITNGIIVFNIAD